MTGFNYAAGAAGVYTVPANSYVLGMSCHSTAGGTLVINPNGAGAGPAITIPAGVSLSLSGSVLGTMFQTNEIGPGSTFTFVGTDSYLVVLG